MDAAVIARIDATLLPQMDRHHLRLLAHCLDSFQAMGRGNEDFLRSLMQQLNAAAEQLQDLADSLGKPPLELQLDDLITAAEARCHHQLQNKSADAP
jgi:CRP-like cAMP-binding protein